MAIRSASFKWSPSAWAGRAGTQLVREIAGLTERAPAQKVRQALTDPRTNIHAGVAILERLFQEHGTLDRASSAFFTGRLDWSGRDTQNATTGRQYRDCLHGLIAEQGDAPPAPPPRQDPLPVIFGGNPAPITFGFREVNSAPLYHYGVGHGTTSPFAHSGIDVGVPYHTPLHAPAAGRVLCVGERGQNLWGQGCGAFNDTGDDGPGGARIGVGNITILLDSGHKLTLGHCRQALVNPGDRVQAGQQVGTSGGMFGAHTHIDVAVRRPDLVTAGDGLEYWLLDPLPALRQAMGDDAAPAFIPAPRLPVPQPQEWDEFVTVTATRDGVPVLQRASPDAPAVRQPLSRGETFEAVMMVLGTDQPGTGSPAAAPASRWRAQRQKGGPRMYVRPERIWLLAFPRCGDSAGCPCADAARGLFLPWDLRWLRRLVGRDRRPS